MSPFSDLLISDPSCLNLPIFQSRDLATSRFFRSSDVPDVLIFRCPDPSYPLPIHPTSSQIGVSLSQARPPTTPVSNSRSSALIRGKIPRFSFASSASFASFAVNGFWVLPQFKPSLSSRNSFSESIANQFIVLFP